MTDLNRVDATITGILEETWKVFWKDFGVYVVAALLASLVVFFSMGLLAGVMAVGYADLVGRLRRGETASPTTIFDGFGKVVQATVLSVIVALGVTLGLMALIIPGAFLAAAWLLSFTAMAEDDLTAGQSLSRSYGIFKNNMAIVALILVLLVISGSLLGSLFLTLPFLLPFSAICLHVAYSTLSPLEGNVRESATRRDAQWKSGTSETRAKSQAEGRGRESTQKRPAPEESSGRAESDSGDSSGRFVPRRIQRDGKF